MTRDDPKFVFSAVTGDSGERFLSALEQTVIECVPEQKATIRIAEKFGFEDTDNSGGLPVFRRKNKAPGV